MEFNFFMYLALGVAGLFVLYVAVRLCSAAYFLSKHEYETKTQRKSNEQQP